jgi:hypothetical protein
VLRESNLRSKQRGSALLLSVLLRPVLFTESALHAAKCDVSILGDDVNEGSALKLFKTGFYGRGDQPVVWGA